MSLTIPRPEYPRPQFMRSHRLCLNGEWQFEIDSGDSGLERGLLQRDLRDRILVPFCPEFLCPGSAIPISSTLFGIAARWLFPPTGLVSVFCSTSKQLITMRRSGSMSRNLAGTGRFMPFSVELPEDVIGHEATIVVRARDYNHIPQARGKQAQTYANMECVYTRTTGIWQTVWLEPVPEVALGRPRLTPDVANNLIRLI